MAGLLDFIQTPAGVGIMSAIAGGLANARRGTPMNNVGRAGMAGLLGYSQAQDQANQNDHTSIQKQYDQAKINEIQSKIANETALKNASMQSMRQATDPGSYGPLGYRPTDPSAFNGQLAQGNAPEDQAFNQANVTAIAEGNNALAPTLPSQFDFGKYKTSMGQILAQSGMPEEAMKFDPRANDGRTSEQKNFEFANTLNPEQRAQFLAGNKNNIPSSIQEWQAYQAMSEYEQQQYREMKRAIPMQDMGGYVAPAIGGGRLGQAIPKTLSPGDLPSTRGEQAKASAQATAGVTQGFDMAKKGRTADTLISQIDRAESVLKRGNASGSLLGSAIASAKGLAGISDASTQDNQTLDTISGWMTSNVPRMEGPQSNYDVQNYKIMSAVVGDRDKPIADRMAALKELRVLQTKYKGINTDVQGADYTPGEELYIQQRRQQGMSDAQIVQELNQQAKPPAKAVQTSPASNKPQTRIFNLDGGGSVQGNLRTDGHYYTKDGKHRIEE